MRTSLAQWAVVLLSAVAMGTACSGADDQEQGSAPSPSAATSRAADPSPGPPTETAGTPSSSPVPSSLPPAAGSSAAAAVAELPTGPGSGPVTITYDGLGQADSTFVGRCTHDGPATTLTGTAGSATVDLVFDPSNVTLTVTDVGLGTSKAALTRVDLTVAQGRLRLDAPLVSADEVIGSVSLDVTCGA